MPMKSYRKKHFQHHKHIGTEKDPENSYKYDLTALNFLKWFCFYYPLRKLFLMYFSEKKDVLSFDFNLITSIFVFFLIHISMFIYFLNASLIELYIILIFIPHVMILPVINWLRTSLEHSPVESSQKNFSLRNFDGSNFLLSFLFGAAGFKFHDIHHINPGIHYLDLGDYKNKFKLDESNNYLSTIRKIYNKS